MKNSIITLIFIFFQVLFSLSIETEIDTPLIGILTQPTEDRGVSFICITYIKYIESSGGRVIPIKYDSSFDDLRETFNSLNGILFPGGKIQLRSDNGEFTQYAIAGRFLINLAITENLKGNPFPIWGTCLGLELLLLTFTNNAKILSMTKNTVNTVGSLHFSKRVSSLFLISVEKRQDVQRSTRFSNKRNEKKRTLPLLQSQIRYSTKDASKFLNPNFTKIRIPNFRREFQDFGSEFRFWEKKVHFSD